MNYLEEDIGYYATLNPSISKAKLKERSLLRYLEYLANIMQEYKDILITDHKTQYEQLDEIYILNRQVKTFNKHICSDMFHVLGGTSLIAGLFCLMTPQEEYLEYINKTIKIKENNEDNFIFFLAHSLIMKKEYDRYKPYFSYLKIIHEILEAMPNDIIKLRKLPNNTNDLAQFYKQLKNQQLEFKEYYQKHTIEQSLAYIKQLPLFSYIVDYKVWYKNNR